MKRLKNNLPRTSATDRLNLILDRCRGRHVLHLGCVDRPFLEEKLEQGTLLHADIARAAASVVGLDNDAEGLDVMNRRGWETVLADAEQMSQRLLDLGRDFDVVIAGEIIEHLDNPGRFLDELARGVQPGTEVVVTTANAYSTVRFGRLLLGREDVHPDHVAYYSLHTLRTLLRRRGYQITAEYPYSIGREIPNIKWFYRATERIAIGIQPWASEGVIAIARTPPGLGGTQ